MKKLNILVIDDTIEKVKDIKSTVRFKYILLKNREIIAPTVKAFREIYSGLNELIKDFEQGRAELIKKYGDVGEGEKAKVVYLKPNSFGAESLTFIEWPKEFNQAILIDFDKMIEKSFINKIGLLLEPMNRMNLLNENEIILSAFF